MASISLSNMAGGLQKPKGPFFLLGLSYRVSHDLNDFLRKSCQGLILSPLDSCVGLLVYEKDNLFGLLAQVACQALG
jgi:hypothetical protein